MNDGIDGRAAAVARPRRSRGPWWIALGLWLALALLASLALWHLRRNAIEAEKRDLNLLSLALTDEIDRGLRGIEVGLQALRTELRDGRLPVAVPASRQALQTRADLMPLVRNLWLVGLDGRTISASDAAPAPLPGTFAPALGDLGDSAMAVSRPFTDGGATPPLVAFAIRFSDVPGTSGGWIVASIPAAELLGAFSVAVPATDARMRVFRGDGVLISGAHASGRGVAPAFNEAAVARRLATQPAVELRRLRDGSNNLVATHGVPRYGIKVVVARNQNAVLAEWRGAAELTVCAFALLLALTAFALRRVQRADRRRAEAQEALQAQRSRASKLESLGTLAGGVAHDFNNVLAGILGYAEMAHDAARAGSDQARHLDRVVEAALRGRALVGRILSFSRGAARTSTVFALQPVVEEALTLLSASLRPGVVLARALDAPGACLRGDSTQAFEAVMNLCTNAMQAMPDGGTLSVWLQRRRVVDSRILSHSALAAGRYLALSVADEGTGIAAEVMEHLFEPFYTTRGDRSGTGLGLAVVHGVVAELGGAIDVESRPGQGARFTLYLPESADKPAPAPRPSDVAPAGRGQKLLVVDDEPQLVGLALELLEGLGYAAEGHVDASAALAAALSPMSTFAAVITDEVMPGLTGTQLTQALRARSLALPVLLVSAYGGALLADRAAQAGVTRTLAKPLRRADLARALADVLR
ncbi:MAG TPA: ATP-binding protein [Caldimonas sp.]|jgi:signal transduction histidine kinase|nr:ATP-binding protein [Caldimonas sp.]